MSRNLGPYVGSLLEKHFSGEDKQVRVEDAGVDLSEVMKKRGRLDDPSIYFSQSIGGHPDYQHLLETSQVEKGAITTLFADLKNFSARGMFVDPTSIKGVKRQVLGTWIDSARIMGGARPLHRRGRHHGVLRWPRPQFDVRDLRGRRSGHQRAYPHPRSGKSLVAGQGA